MSAFTDGELLAAYAVLDRTKPYLRANMIASIDGAATHDGLSGGLNNPADRQVFDMLRRLADVVVVGAGTLRAEGYGGLHLDQAGVAWRRAAGLTDHPVLAIVSSNLALDPHSELFTKAPVRPLVFTHEDSPPAQRSALGQMADVVTCGRAEVDPAAVRAVLIERGYPQILTEGGPRLLGTLAELLDELCLTISPFLEGGDAVRIVRDAAFVHRPMRLAGVLRAEDMLFLRYQHPCTSPRGLVSRAERVGPEPRIQDPLC